MYIIIGIWGGPFAAHLAAALRVLPSTRCRLAPADAGGADLPVLPSRVAASTSDLAQAAATATAQTLLFFAFLPPSPSRCRCGRCTRRFARRPRRGATAARWCWRHHAEDGAVTASCASRMPIAPDAARIKTAWLIIALSLIAVIYIGFVALVQQDMKKLVAYSSIAHMGFVTLGFFIFSSIVLGVSGAWCRWSRTALSRRDVPVHRRALRPRALARDRFLRRRGQHHASLRRSRSSRCCHSGLQRAPPASSAVDGDPRAR